MSDAIPRTVKLVLTFRSLLDVSGLLPGVPRRARPAGVERAFHSDGRSSLADAAPVSRVALEHLEPRLLLSADLPGAVTPPPNSATDRVIRTSNVNDNARLTDLGAQLTLASTDAIPTFASVTFAKPTNSLGTPDTLPLANVATATTSTARASSATTSR